MSNNGKFFNLLFPLFLSIPTVGLGQLTSADSLLMLEIVSEFQESITTKDSIRFNKLFFHSSVSFVGIMSKETEWAIKKDYSDFQGVAVSNHLKFIRDICISQKDQVEKVYNVELSGDGIIGSISFDYAFYSDHKMIQWGYETWNVVQDGEAWLITDVIYTIRFPDVEPFPMEE